MKKWITWKEILKNWRISPLDFYSDYIHRGLRPHTQTGDPLTPRDIMGSVFSQRACLEDPTPIPFSVEGVEDRIYYHSKRQIAESSNNDLLNMFVKETWADFELPTDVTEADLFFKEMEKTIYKRKDADNYRKNKPIDEDAIEPIQKDRPSTRHKKASQKVAKKKWDETPPGEEPLTIREMSELPEILEACEGKKYKDLKTYQRWFTEFNPNKKPGKRKQRK
jgi:hypothetical protein